MSPANKAKTGVKRNPDGTIAKGSASNNPSGRPSTPPELVEAFRERTPRALALLDLVIDDYTKRVVTAKGDPMVPAAAAVKAAEVMLNRGYGTAPAIVELKAELEESVQLDVKVAPKSLDRLRRIAKVLVQAGVLDGDGTDGDAAN